MEMPQRRLHRYLRWLGDCWELKESEELAFAYQALRRES